jgi:hypothetical protein
MGEAGRRMRVAAIGAEISWSDDHRKAAIRQPPTSEQRHLITPVMAVVVTRWAGTSALRL